MPASRPILPANGNGRQNMPALDDPIIELCSTISTEEPDVEATYAPSRDRVPVVAALPFNTADGTLRYRILRLLPASMISFVRLGISGLHASYGPEKPTLLAEFLGSLKNVLGADWLTMLARPSSDQGELVTRYLHGKVGVRLSMWANQEECESQW
jgi:hypothetical protein